MDLKQKLVDFGCGSEFVDIALEYKEFYNADEDIETFIEYVEVEHAKVEEALGKGRVLALIHASDAAEDGCRKLDGKARATTAGRGIPAVRAFSADELSLASGRTNVIHAALIQGGAARKFLAAAARLERYREGASAFADQNGLDTDKNE